MPRRSRTVVPGFPHHVTQRGNRRERVFFSDADRRAYLGWLGEYAGAHCVEILAYCLMPNHVHLVAVPRTADGLHRTLKPLHMRYAQAVNRVRGWSGHLWQGRFFSSPLDSEYFLAAVRYVERNPLRAGLVERAESYPWSSAAAHCGLRSDGLLPNDSPWALGLNEIRDWSAFLADGDDERDRTLRRHADQGLPCGSDEFVERLEQITGRELRYRSPGGQKQTLRPG
jgi:putative transposase